MYESQLYKIRNLSAEQRSQIRDEYVSDFPHVDLDQLNCYIDELSEARDPIKSGEIIDQLFDHCELMSKFKYAYADDMYPLSKIETILSEILELNNVAKLAVIHKN